MIPILFDTHATAFSTNGVGRLSDCISCIVTEERNGIYECKFKYPITGKWYNYMRERGGTVVCIHDDQKDVQPFDIYGYTAPIDGVVTFYAHHISYRLNRITVKPFTATSVADAFSQLRSKSNEENPFTFWTDKTASGDFKLDHPESIRPLLGGQRGSILDTYGKGDYKFDNFYVRLYANRGVDSGVTIRYGKNLADMTVEYDKSDTYNTIRPYWKGTDGTVVIGNAVSVLQTLTDPWTDENGNTITDENGTQIEFEYTVDKSTVSKDFSAEFQEQPTAAQLQDKAAAFLEANQPWIPKQNITVDFVQLWQTTEYADVAALQRVGLCDRVSIYYPELGVTAENQKVIRVVYNVLTERFDEMELGEPRTTLADDIRSSIRDEFEDFAESGNFESIMQEAINHATELITGGLGGHVVFTLDANGKPQEILIMDTEDVDTAVHVLRINQNGIGFSSTGYEGPFTTAWTLDGSFVADFITAGSLTANIIKGGTLTLGGANNGNGVMRLLNSSNQQVGLFNKDGVVATAGEIGGWTIDSGLSAEDVFPVSGGGAFNGTAKLDPAKCSLLVSSVYAYPTPQDGDGDFLTYGADYDNTETNTRNALGLRWYTVYQGSRSMHAFIGHDGYTFKIQVYEDFSLFDKLSNKAILSYSTNDSMIVCNASEVRCYGDFEVYGNKNRIVKTASKGNRALYAYETASPYFGDIGESTIGENGTVRIEIEPIFGETIDHDGYCVFLQKEGPGDLWVDQKDPDAFTVKGTPGLKFSWELKAKQIDHKNRRLEEKKNEDR